jgi:lipopolysaccharide/colanic/teichoic acid biosynthesis glycosyltransferase
MFAAPTAGDCDCVCHSTHKPDVSLWYRYCHRIFDLAFSLFALLFLLILFPLIGLCIRVDSPGPVLYRQQRVGCAGQLFWIYKFRSMYCDAERLGVRWAQHRDARVTRIGRWLRATHLDELPQIINILRGEMSVIGPRPEREPFVSRLEQMLPRFHQRLAVSPGLTGWAQVRVRYADTIEAAELKLQLDLFYIEHWSLWFDLVILCATVYEVVRCKGR